MRAAKKKPPRVSTPPMLGLGVVLFGVAAVLAAAAALFRYYGRRHAPAPQTEDAAWEIPAPDLETEGPTKP